MLRQDGRHLSRCILAVMLTLLTLAGGCAASSGGNAVPDPSRADPKPRIATPASPMMTPPDY